MGDNWPFADYDDHRPPAETAPPLFYIPNTSDFWEVELMDLIRKHGAIIFMDERKNYKIQGDGIRLHIPFDWLVMVPAEDLVAHIITGINVSLANRERLNY